VILVGLAILKFTVARRLRQRRSWVFCIVVAALSCIGIPFGTALGVFTLLVLSRHSVKCMFDIKVPSATGVVAGGGGA